MRPFPSLSPLLGGVALLLSLHSVPAPAAQSIGNGHAAPGSASNAAAPDSLEPSTIKAVAGATFEVVMLKPPEGDIKYAHKLPMDLVPYSERTDHYFSVGTAFAIGPNTWITAGHVFDFGHKGLYKLYRLRDASGKVYDIDKILKYSMHRDFVVFSIKHPPHIVPLPTSTTPQLNDKVYSVGNALGQGVVFRDGVYTSATPEEEDGAWKWIRFSAPASPGNSGGPLLDAQGRVIGVIIGKSENENLNYALPIAEVLHAPDHVATLDARIIYQIDNMPNQSGNGRIHKTYRLPMTYDQLDRVTTRDLYRFGLKVQHDFYAQRKGVMFPDGKGSLPMLYSDYSSQMPGLIGLGEDGNWDSYSANKSQTSDFGVNGTLTYGSLGDSEMLLFHKPDGIRMHALFSDSRLLMDTLLKGYPIYRTVASERVRITSLGKAVQESTYTDHYGRKWLVRLWNINYADEQIALFMLPVPGGFAGMLRLESTGDMPSHLDDLRDLADFTCLAYYGTLTDWREFLGQRDLLPRAFSHIRINFTYGKRFSYASDRIRFSYGPGEMRITGNSDLKLRLAYFREGSKTVWDVNQVRVGDDKDSATFFTVARFMHPARQLDDKFQSTWRKMAHHEYPFNRAAFFDDNRTIIGEVYTRGLPPGNLASEPVLYSAFYGTDGNQKQSVVADKLGSFMAGLKVYEK